jgi:hypothetical protein
MWLQAIITPSDLEHVLNEITPMRIALDGDAPERRYLWLDRPSHMAMTDGHGIRIVTSACLQWDVIGTARPITLRKVTALITPTISQRDGHDVLAFSACIEDADLSSVPEFIEVPILARVNEALQREHAQIAWHFTDTLNFHFNLPQAMDGARAMQLFTRWGAVRTSHEGVAIAASFTLQGEPRGRSAPMPDAKASALRTLN